MNKYKNIDFEIKFFEGILDKRPEFFEAISALAELYTKKGLHDKGLALDKRLFRIRPKDPIVLYNLACSYSLLGDAPKAFNAIKKAILSGYDDIKFLEKDPDLDNLRLSQRFQRYMARIVKKNSREK